MSEKKHIIDNAELMAELDWEKNNAIGLTPQILSIGSHKVAFWICLIHKTQYKQVIRDKNFGRRGCSICLRDYKSSINRERCIKDRMVLAETNPDLALEWVGCGDSKITPYTCVSGSNVKVKWKCRICDGEFEAYVSNRALKGSKCPYCCNQKVLIGYNDLQTLSCGLAMEWSEKNTFLPKQVTPHSNKQVFWKCFLGHEDYLMSVKRHSSGQGCPICAKQSQTSFPEQAIYYYIKKVFPDANNRYKFENHEIDIFIPLKKIGIEYNGYFSHKNKEEKDIVKRDFFHSVGIELISVKEYKYEDEKVNASFYIHQSMAYAELTNLINELLLFVCGEISVDVDCERDLITIKEQYLFRQDEVSLANLRPDLAKEWDKDRNGKITPKLVTVGSNQKYYWRCPICDNVYKASPKHRSHGTSCPVCSSKSVKTGVNDLKTVCPLLLKEWDYEINSLDPSIVLAGGTTKYYWKCALGHSYLCTIPGRIKGNNCPVCSGKKVLVGFNDLLSQNPRVAKEWDYEMNACLPNEVHYNSQSKKYHWICSKCGCKWISLVRNRTRCPECRKKDKQINVYDANTLDFLFSFEDAKSLCEYLNLDYKKQRGNITSVCSRKQKTIMGKYVLRHANDDEFFSK
jgi:translation initiation factor IF-1